MPTQPASLLDRLLGTDASAGAGRLAALDRSQSVVEFSPDGTVLTANENFLRAFGCTLEQVRGRHHRMFVHADEGASPDYARFWQDLARGEYRSGQFRRVTPDGREVWLQATYNPVRDRTGKVVRVVKFAHDVSGRRREELDNVGQLQAIDRSMAVIEFSLDGTVLNANRNFLDALGYALEDVQGQHYRMFMPQGAADTAAYRELWAQLAQGRYQSGQFERRAKDGRPVWIEASYNPILDASGRPYKVVKFATDVTAQRNRNADFEGQIAALHRAQAVIEFELDGTIRDANANFLAAVGYRREDIVGRHHSMFVEPGERDTPAYRAFWQALGRGESESDRYLRRRADGSALWLQASYSPILDASGRPYKVVKYCTDVTAQVQQAEALRTLFAQIEQVAENLLTGTREIAAGNGDLSVRTEHQASALEKTAATMEQLSGAITSTAHNAEMARDLTRDADEASVRGQQAVDRLAAAMRDIRDASRRVSELLGVIDAIAFQTNILALNAAVEAARAGDKGRGFAVVASEVRALAQRCSASAKEIKATLDVANAAVSIGGERVQDAGRAMDQIGSSVQSAARLAGEIADAAREQRTGIQQVNTALQSMEDVTQQNAALVEQIAASSGSLESMAASLSGALGDFQARDAGEAAQAPRARATHRPSMAMH